MIPTDRHLCPLLCGWHHDMPSPGLEDLAGIEPAPEATTLQAIIGSITEQALHRRAAAAEAVLREHLDTHTVEEFVRTIQELRAQLPPAPLFTESVKMMNSTGGSALAVAIRPAPAIVMQI